MTVQVQECRDIPDDILEHLVPTRSAQLTVRPLHDELLKQVVRDDHEKTVLLVFVATHSGVVTHTRIVKLRWWMPEVGDCGWRLCENATYPTQTEVPSKRGGSPSSVTLVY